MGNFTENVRNRRRVENLERGAKGDIILKV
jgi:hypothetical protein